MTVEEFVVAGWLFVFVLLQLDLKTHEALTHTCTYQRSVTRPFERLPRGYHEDGGLSTEAVTLPYT